jgi:hypothetical protein
MFTCLICRFEVEFDDAIVTTARGGCVCLRCYLREVEDHKPLPKQLRREVTSLLAAA